MLFVAKVFESFEQSGLVCVCGDGPENIALSVCVRYASYCGILVGIINNTSNMWLLVTCVASSASTDKTKKRNRCWTAIKSNEIVVRYFGALVFSRLHATKMRRALWKMRISAVSSACFLSTHSRRENRIVYPIKYVYYDMMVCIRHHCDIIFAKTYRDIIRWTWTARDSVGWRRLRGPIGWLNANLIVPHLMNMIIITINFSQPYSSQITDWIIFDITTNM